MIFTFAGEYRNVQRERVAGVYGVSSYFAARTIVELPRSVLWTVILVRDNAPDAPACVAADAPACVAA